MKTETKFDINNLVKRKFDVDVKDIKGALEIMQITSDTCYAGTQTFYMCRPIICTKKFNTYKEAEGFTWHIAHGISREDHQMGWNKYREDELVEAPQEVIDIILGNHDSK